MALSAPPKAGHGQRPGGTDHTVGGVHAGSVRTIGLGYAIGDRWLVDGVDLEVDPGELVAVIGPNGAGKSTLCRLLAGDLQPSAGEVEVLGRPLTSFRRDALARARGVLPQHPTPTAFRVIDVVLMGRHPWLARSAAPGDDDVALAHSAMVEVGIDDLAERSCATLSGGEQARVHLARVLVQSTPVLLLDEPTASLDLRHQHLVASVARRRASAGAAVVAVLHDLVLAAAYADRVVALANGRVTACGPPAEVLSAEVLTRLYGHPVAVGAHPTQGWVVPVAERTIVMGESHQP